MQIEAIRRYEIIKQEHNCKTEQLLKLFSFRPLVSHPITTITKHNTPIVIKSKKINARNHPSASSSTISAEDRDKGIPPLHSSNLTIWRTSKAEATFTYLIQSWDFQPSVEKNPENGATNMSNTSKLTKYLLSIGWK